MKSVVHKFFQRRHRLSSIRYFHRPLSLFTSISNGSFLQEQFINHYCSELNRSDDSGTRRQRKRLQLESTQHRISTLEIHRTFQPKRSLSTSSSSAPVPPPSTPITTDARLLAFSSLSKDASTAPIDYPTSKRWLAIPPANVVHLTIGSVYVYSMWTPSLGNILGVVGQSACDWSQSELIPVFSVAALTLGITTSTLGKWIEKVGPRMSGVIGSVFWGAGLCVTGLGAEIHSLPFVYVGYGLIGGVGWGFMYLTPVTTCMKWFPDRRGLATGLALSAFGLGAAIAPPIIQSLLDCFFVAPDFIGTVDEVILSTLNDGTQVVAPGSPVGIPNAHVVVASASDAAKVGLEPGIYDLNSGDTGVSRALGTMGFCYGLTGVLASTFMKVPATGWVPDGYEVDQSSTAGTEVGLTADAAVKTTQFPLLWWTVFGNATGGVTLLSSSKLMITDIWAGALPDIVTSSFAAGYVASLGAANALGRFGWAYASDHIGRSNTYKMFSLGVPIVGGAPILCHFAMDATAVNNAAPISNTMLLAPLAAFYGGSVLALTFYGGIFSVLPTYIADLWGQKHSGAIHGKLLTAWAASAICGPMGLSYLRSTALESSIHDLLEKVDDETFYKTFNCNIAEAQPLIDAKTVTISRLMDIAPEGTIDPTPFLYDNTCFIAAGLIGSAAVANLLIRPLDVQKLLKEENKVKESNNI